MYDIDEIIDQVRCTVADHLYVPMEAIASSAALTKDLGADSLDIVEICIMLESWFNIEIEVPQARQFRSVLDIASFLHRRVAPSARPVAV